MKNQNVLRSTFISIGVLLALTQLLTAGAYGGVYSSERPYVPPQCAFVVVDSPGAVNGTYAQTIDAAGVVAGTYLDENFLLHGFVRAHDGTITAIDAPEGIMTDIGGDDLSLQRQ